MLMYLLPEIGRTGYSRHTIIKLLRIIFVLVFEKRPIKTPYTKQYSVLIGQFESMHGNKKGFLTNRWGCLNCHNEKPLFVEKEAKSILLAHI
jgi:hypothetical protein